MDLPSPEDRRILHFTHLRHLPTIVNEGSLLADSVVGARLTHEVGDRGIKANRRELVVTCGPGGHPCDYVPFYFAPKSPMLYKIAIGGVPHYQEGQDPLVYFVSTIGDVVRAGLPWVFSDGNCGATLTSYYDDLGLLDDKVDWPLQDAKWWNSTADDPTRATRRAAEFLVHERAPFSLIRGMVVRTQETAMKVETLLNEVGESRRVVVRSDWYYSGARFK